MSAVGSLGTPLPSPTALEMTTAGRARSASAEAAASRARSCLGMSISLPVLGLIVANVLSSVSLVAVNKMLVVSYGFRYILLLSACHFLVGYLFLHFSSNPSLGQGRLFTRKALALSVILPVAAVGAFSIAMMNYSLRFNSVSSYQLLKVAVLPATVALSGLQGTKLTRVDVGCAVLVTFGTAVATVTDLTLTMFGTAIGIIAVLATAQYQVYQGRVQKENDVSSTQALHGISLPQAVLTFVCSMAFETTWVRLVPSLAAQVAKQNAAAAAAGLRGAVAGAAGGSSGGRISANPLSSSGLPEDIWSHPYQVEEVALILLTCACAVVLNYSSIALIGRVSAVGFQFVNQLKTLLIMSLGFMLFSEAADTKRVISLAVGLAFVLTGIAWYTKDKSSKPSVASNPAAASSSSSSGGAAVVAAVKR